jgi:hypothetical protein
MANEIEKDEFESLPPWLAEMRRAAREGVKASDVKEIVAKQVELAKQGDARALKFVFNTVLGGDQMKGGTFIQNNYHSDPAAPTNALPGTNGKLKTMEARRAAGLPLTTPRDRANVDLS